MGSTVVVHLFSHVRLFANPCTASPQACLFFTISRSLLKPMSVELILPSNHLILCHPLLLLPSILLSIRVFCNESVFASRGQSNRASASAPVLPMNIQGWFPLGLTGLISLDNPGLEYNQPWSHISYLLLQKNKQKSFCPLSVPQSILYPGQCSYLMLFHF